MRPASFAEVMGRGAGSYGHDYDATYMFHFEYHLESLGPRG
ncbi:MULTISPECIES: hypothetical protein [unclassified Brevibacterium]|nr:MULTISPECIES: hypothetical protein [unclassified Brevibacterium]